MHLVVVLQGVEAHHQRSAGAEGTQPHVHPEDEAFCGALAQHFDQLSRQALEVLVVGQGAALSPGFSRLGKGKNQIDIGGKVELAGAELSQREHRHRLRLAGFVLRSADISALALMQALERDLNRGLGKGRGVTHRFVQIGKTADIPPGDAHPFLAPQASQDGHENHRIVAVAEVVFDQLTVVRHGVKAVAVVALGERSRIQHRRQRGRRLLTEFRYKLAAGEHPPGVSRPQSFFRKRHARRLRALEAGVDAGVGDARKRIGQRHGLQRSGLRHGQPV